MQHARKTIRDWLVATVTGLATTGANVYPSRLYPLEADKLPALSVTTGPEEIGENSTQQSDYRQVEAVVEIIVAGNTEFEDTADQIAFEVEAAVHAAAPPSSNVLKVELDRSEPARDAEGEQRVMRLQLTYLIDYRTTPGNPTL